jgi:hypothetical protein
MAAVLRKTKMCRFYGMGICTKGDQCAFAHSHSDLQQCPDLQKTQLCMAFERNGFCRDSSACKYAHGAHELRTACAKPEDDIARLADDVVAAFRQQQMQQGFGFPFGSQVSTNGMMQADAFGMPSFPAGMYSPDVAGYTHPMYTTTDTISSDALVMEEFLKVLGNNLAFGGGGMMTKPSESEVPTRYQSTASSLSSDGASTEGDASPQESSNVEDIPAENTPVRLPDEVYTKTKMCQFYPKGLCRKGAACGYAHDSKELKIQPDLYRTRMCLTFARLGSCQDGDACKYAHGMDQLRGDAKNASQQSACGAMKKNNARTKREQVEKPQSPQASTCDTDDSGSVKSKSLDDPVFVTFSNGRVCVVGAEDVQSSSDGN